MPKKKNNGFAYDGYIDYPGVGLITDRDVYELVKKHSSFIERLDPRKMTEMTLLGQCVLMKVIDPPKNSNWRFYKKNGEPAI